MQFDDLLRYFHPLKPARELKAAPLPVAVGGHKYVLFRAANGKPAALLDQCPHRHTPLSGGQIDGEGRLRCPYHGWTFAADGQGHAPSQPEIKCSVKSFQVVERYGYLWIGNHDLPAAALPQLDQPGFEFAGASAALFPAPLHLVLDNFGEDEHFPYIHKFFGWEASEWPAVKHDVQIAAAQTAVTYSGPQKASPWLPFLGVKRGDRFHNNWTTRFDPPQATFTFEWRDSEGREERPLSTRAAIFFVPESEDRTQVHAFLFVRYGNAFLRALKPLVRHIALKIARDEIGYDAAFIGQVAHIQESFAGMRLGRFDKALVHHRSMLNKLYLHPK